jgi:hypothetical protein
MITHHAFLYGGLSFSDIPRLSKQLSESGVVNEAVCAQWGIDQSRALSEEVQRTDPGGRTRHFIVAATTMTVESQNALLKLFEEPPGGMLFHCLFPAGMSLLPTLQSRLFLIASEAAEQDDSPVVWEAWVRLSIAERLLEVEKRTKEKDLGWVMAIGRGGMLALQGCLKHEPKLPFARLAMSLYLIGTRGASNKMLLEDVALAFPLPPKTG